MRSAATSTTCSPSPATDGACSSGDVCGKGAAAAAVTSQIRYTLRAAAVYDPDPATVLGTLNSALRRDYERNGGRFCTAAFGVLTPAPDGFDLSLASGGHPAPAAAARGRHRRLPAGRRRPVPRRHRRRGLYVDHDPAGRRRHLPAVHRRADRGAHRQRSASATATWPSGIRGRPRARHRRRRHRRDHRPARGPGRRPRRRRRRAGAQRASHRKRRCLPNQAIDRQPDPAAASRSRASPRAWNGGARPGAGRGPGAPTRPWPARAPRPCTARSAASSRAGAVAAVSAAAARPTGRPAGRRGGVWSLEGVAS